MTFKPVGNPKPKNEKKEQTPAEMFRERQEAIKQAIEAKDMNIRISWAINNAVEIGMTNSNSIKTAAYMFLRIFEEMHDELSTRNDELAAGKKKSQDVGRDSAEHDISDTN